MNILRGGYMKKSAILLAVLLVFSVGLAYSAGVVDAVKVYLQKNGTIVFEGSTSDAYQTTITVVNPTADRTVTIPNKNVRVASDIKVILPDANGKSIAATEAGDIQSGGGAGVWNLPEASTCIGCVFDFVVTVAGNMDINAADGDIILGLTNATGDATRCATVGSSIRLVVLDDTNIAPIGQICIGGAWADVN
jgi:hypothetical protein